MAFVDWQGVLTVTDRTSWPPDSASIGPSRDAWLLLELVPRMNRWAEIQATRLRPDGEISLRQLGVLYALSSGQVPRTHATAADLARWARVRPTVMTRMIDRLERSGYVTRNPDPGDRRRTHIRLTDAGLEIKLSVSEALVDQLMGPIQALPEDERAELAAGLRQLHEIFSRLEAGGMLDASESEPLFDE